MDIEVAVQSFTTSLNEQTLSLLQEVDAAKADLVKLGAFSDETVTAVFQNELPRRLRDTLAIESIRVSARVTSAVLDGKAFAQIDGYTERAILNVFEANEYLEKSVKQVPEIDRNFLGEVNRLITKDLGKVQDAGKIRSSNVQIDGATVQPPHWADVRDLLDRNLNEPRLETFNPVVGAARVHWLISRIHPFEDGNGRTARLLQDFVLMKSSLFPVGIPQRHRAVYYDALEDADHGDPNRIVQMVAETEINELRRVAKVGSRPAVRSELLSRAVKQIRQQSGDRDKGVFKLWEADVNGLVSDLEMALNELSAVPQDLKFSVTTHESPDFSDWLELRDRNSWRFFHPLMSVLVIFQQQFAYKFSLYAKRHKWENCEDSPRDYNQLIGIYLDVRKEKGDRWNNVLLTDERFISIREILPTHGDWVVYRDPQNSGDTADGTGWKSEIFDNHSDVVDELLKQLLVKIGIVI